MEPTPNKRNDEKKRDTEAFKPIGGLYDDPRDHGSAGTQHADEGTQERDQAGNRRGDEPTDNAAGSPTRSNASKDYPADGHGNG